MWKILSSDFRESTFSNDFSSTKISDFNPRENLNT